MLGLYLDLLLPVQRGGIISIAILFYFTKLLLLWLRTAYRVEGPAFCSSFRAKIDFRNIRRAHALSVEQRFLCSYLILYPQVTSDISCLRLISDHILVLNSWVLATARSLIGPFPPFLVAANSGIFNLSISLIFGFYNATFITQFLLIMDISMVHEMGDSWILASSIFASLHCIPGMLDILMVS